MKLLTTTIREKLLANGRANRRKDGLPREDDAIDHKPVVKLFTPDANCIWLLTEIIDDTDEAYGLCDLGMGWPELGYVSLSKLETVRGPLNRPVRCDQSFKANKTLSAYAADARQAGAIKA